MEEDDLLNIEFTSSPVGFEAEAAASSWKAKTQYFSLLKVCPHAGGVGLCEMVQHLQYWDYASLSGTMDGRLIEYMGQQHEHFVPGSIVIENARYMAPKLPGYSTEFIPGVIDKFGYPNGTEWIRMIREGLFEEPDEAELVNA